MSELVKISGTELVPTSKPETKNVESIDSGEIAMPIGQRVAVRRTNGNIEYNWRVAGIDTRIDPSTGKPIEYRIVTKIDNGIVLTKALRLSELEAVEEKLDDKTERDLGEPAILSSAVEGVIDLGHVEAIRIDNGSTKSEYDSLFDDEIDESKFGIEAAAVRSPISDEDRLSRERIADDARAAAQAAYKRPEMQ